MVLLAFFVINKEMWLLKRLRLDLILKCLKKFLPYIGLNVGNYLWDYSLKELNENYRESLRLRKESESKTSNTIVISLNHRKAVCQLVDADGKIARVDKTGFVFPRKNSDGVCPIIYIPQKIKHYGTQTITELEQLSRLMWLLEDKYAIYYKNISKIELTYQNGISNYLVALRANNASFALKKKLNVENIIDAVNLAGIIHKKTVGNLHLKMADNGLFYQQEE